MFEECNAMYLNDNRQQLLENNRILAVDHSFPLFLVKKLKISTKVVLVIRIRKPKRNRHLNGHPSTHRIIQVHMYTYMMICLTACSVADM